MIALGIAFALLLVIGVPVSFAIGLASVVGIWALDLRYVAVPTRMFVGIDNFVLLAAPFYILAGEIMGGSGSTGSGSSSCTRTGGRCPGSASSRSRGSTGPGTRSRRAGKELTLCAQACRRGRH